MWTYETISTYLTYPVQAPPLKPGSANIVSVIALDDGAQEIAVDKSLLQVLAEASQAELARVESDIRILGLDEIPELYLLAQLYQSLDLRAAAIDALERLDSQGGTSASLRQQLGDLYLEVGLYGRAEARYQDALTVAEAGTDVSAQAAAHVGLARVAYAFEEAEQALRHLKVAESLYREAGDREHAELVASEIARQE